MEGGSAFVPRSQENLCFTTFHHGLVYQAKRLYHVLHHFVGLRSGGFQTFNGFRLRLRALSQKGYGFLHRGHGFVNHGESRVMIGESLVQRLNRPPQLAFEARLVGLMEVDAFVLKGDFGA